MEEQKVEYIGIRTYSDRIRSNMKKSKKKIRKSHK